MHPRGNGAGHPCAKTRCDTPVADMTIREYFAAQALVGLLAAPDMSASTWGEFASYAVRQADALLAELAKEKT